MCEKDYGGIKGVDMRDRKESKTTSRFSVSDQEAKCVASCPHRRCKGDLTWLASGMRQVGGMGEGEANSTLARQICDAGGRPGRDV